MNYPLRFINNSKSPVSSDFFLFLKAFMVERCCFCGVQFVMFCSVKYDIISYLPEIIIKMHVYHY